MNYKNLFWNANESRLRTGYRIFIATIFYFTIMECFFYFAGPLRDMNVMTPLTIFGAMAIVRIIRGFGSVWFSGRFFDHRSFTNFGMKINKHWWADLFFGMALGIILMNMIFFIEYLAGWITITDIFYTGNPTHSFPYPFLVFGILFISVALSEELFFRGYIITNLVDCFSNKRINKKTSAILALIIASFLFALFHAGGPATSLICTINLILWGTLFGFAFISTGRLSLPIGLHITWNFFQGNIYGFPVSGASLPSKIVSLVSIQQNGPDFWTGGTYGPEGGFVSSLAFIFAFIMISLWVHLRRNK